MNIPEPKLLKYFEALLKSSLSFVIYRLPWTDDAIFILQEEGYPETFNRFSDLNTQKGFIIYPFEVTSQHPAIIIRKDHSAQGWDAITQLLESLELNLEATDSKPSQALKDITLLQAQYNEAFGRFMHALNNQGYDKLVLSRQQTVPLTDQFDPLDFFIKAANSYPRMMISLSHTPISGTWIGSTPEILLTGRDEQWQTVSLAGTMPMQGEIMPDQWSQKNQQEQEMVSEYIRKIVKKFGHKLNEKGPYTARAGQLVHLRTDFYFQLKDIRHVGQFIDDLYPTPAVCGLPKDEAYQFILTNEGYDRSYYSGIIGEYDPTSSTRLYINLRCMQLGQKQATLYAGGGILASSEADGEWEETQQKLNTMRSLL